MMEFLSVMSIIFASQENFDANWNERENETILTPANSPPTDQLPILIIKITPNRQTATETVMMIAGGTIMEIMAAQNLPVMKLTK